MAFELAKAFVSIEANQSKFNSQMASIKSEFTSFASGLSRIAGSLGIAFGLEQLISSFQQFRNEAVAAASEAMDSQARLAAVLKATGNSARFTAEELSRFASKLQSKTTFGDETIQNAMAKLATFRKVSGQTFKEATELALDLAATGFGSAESAAVMLGKALEDPISGLTALRRVGVSFSEEQKKQIEKLVEQNNLWAAQAEILKGVAIQVGNVAKAMADMPSGRLKQLEEEIGDLKEELGKAAIPGQVRKKEFQRDVLKGVVDWRQIFEEMWKGLDFEMNMQSPEAASRSTRNNLLKLIGFAFGIRDWKIDTKRMFEPVQQLPQAPAPLQSYMKAMMRGMGFGPQGAFGGMPFDMNTLPFRARLFGNQAVAGINGVPGWLQRNAPADTQASEQDRFRRFLRGMLPSIGLFSQMVGSGLGSAAWSRIRRDDRRQVGTTSFEGINQAFQEALNDNKNPVHRSNKILDSIDGAMGKVMEATKQSAIDLATLAKNTVVGVANSLNIFVANE